MRLIDVDAFLEKMKRTSRYFDVKFDIEEMPSIDAVPVVRCGECAKPIEDCPFKDHVMLKTDFCSYGERKEGSG